jgi:hypothetical protein
MKSFSSAEEENVKKFGFPDEKEESGSDLATRYK